MTSMYGWTEDAPPAFDDPKSPAYTDLLPRSVLSAAVLFDMVHRYADSSDEHDRIIADVLGEAGPDGTRRMVAGFIRLMCGALTVAGADTADPASEARLLVGALRAVEAEEADFMSEDD